MFEMTLRISWCGMTRLARVAVCNCHLHRLTANKSHGFTETHDMFWNELASTILAHRVRILAGDFKMSLWIVAREMRRRGVQTTLAAAFAWADPCASEAKSDSRGIMFIGPVTSTKLFWGPSVFTSEIADVGSEVPRLDAGQGYPLASYLPKGADAVTAMEETFASSRHGMYTQSWAFLPVAMQMSIKGTLFVPRGLWFQKGAHMPLLLYLR